MVVKDNELTPKTGNKSGDAQTIATPVPVTQETQTEVFKKTMPDVLTGGRAATYTKGKLNKGGASRVSD